MDETESRPAGVTQASTQAGEVRARWAWSEPSVWTDRMLCALQDGVKRGLWYRGNIRWPNAYSAEQGVFILTTAHATAGKSLYG